MSKQIVGIDVGLHGIAFSIYDGSSFIKAGYFLNEVPSFDRIKNVNWMPAYATQAAKHISDMLDRESECEIFIEYPQIYVTSLQGNRNQNDLIKLALVCGGISQWFHLRSSKWITNLVLPANWKGSVKKEITQARIEQDFTQAQKTRICWPDDPKRHNDVYDAIGISRWGLKRCGVEE